MVNAVPQKRQTEMCPDLCYPAPPPCKYGDLPLGQPGCWRCCVAVSSCQKICASEPPVCASTTEAAFYVNGCWTCCTLA
ncbi:hypothetical protein AMATHDRAFT_66212 [Amanita thiersii Skay4041]|uniref:Uncharacterized protein n=1 Tax=Amanita thiersii Skay4041 TaxID=703135 RepID=A0A2A9NAQ7_9AGAR|nr:hypothetical protein AMATHDRAFT_66212 [Amanita thiersii Skay4041]